MYETANFKILAPLSGKPRAYTPDEIQIGEGDPIIRDNDNVDLFLRIERVWTEKFVNTVKKGGKMFAGPKYRLSSYHSDEKGITLDLGPTDYRELIGTNAEAGGDPEYMKELIERGEKEFEDSDAFFSNTLGICSAVETSDGKVLVGLRSDSVGEYPRCWHVIGGHPEPKVYQGKDIDLIDAMDREIIGELGIEYDERKSTQVLGLARNQRTRKPELLFSTQLYLTFDEIRDRRGTEKDEHFALFGLSHDELIDFLSANQKEFTFPEGHDLSSEDQERMAPKGKHPNTVNFFVPPGEANLVMHLACKGLTVSERTRLSYLSKT